MALYDLLGALGQGVSTGFQTHDALQQRERQQSIEDEDREERKRLQALERAIMELNLKSGHAELAASRVPQFNVGPGGTSVTGIRDPKQADEYAARYARPGQDVNWQTIQTDDGYVQVNPRTNETRPVSVGGAQAQPRTTPRQPREQVVVGPDGEYTVVNLDDRTTAPLGLQAGARPTAGAAQAAARNRAQAARIDEVIAAIEERPESIGLRVGLQPEIMSQRTDPGGVAIRAMLADIGSMQIVDRSGAAVSVQEFERLRPFIPSERDTPEAAITKLRSLQNGINQILTEMEGGHGDVGGGDGGGLSDDEIYQKVLEQMGRQGGP